LKSKGKLKNNFEFLQARKGIMLNFDELNNGQNSSYVNCTKEIQGRSKSQKS